MSDTETKASTAKPITAYVVTQYTDASGKHEVGDEVQFPREDKEGVLRLIDYGVLSKTPPKDEPTQAPVPSQPQG